MPPSRAVCIGGAVIDRKFRLLAPAVPATSNPATADPATAAGTPGGVARNVAENLARLGVATCLVARVGDDEQGAAIRAGLAAAGVEAGAVTPVPGAGTAQYVAVLDPAGELVLGVADMAVLERVTCADVDGAWPDEGWVFADCNLAPEVLAHLLDRVRAGARTGARAGAAGPAVQVAVDAVSTAKVTRLPARLSGVGALFCNREEARALLGRCGLDGSGPDRVLAGRLRAAGAARVVLTRGADGVLTADGDGVRAVPAVPARVRDVTGAGDALVAGTLAPLLAGHPLAEAVALGTLVAALTVESGHSVRPDLSAALIARERARRAGALPGPLPPPESRPR